MSQQKQYILELQAEGKDLEEQDAIEWALYAGWVRLTGDLETDRRIVAEQLPLIVESYRRMRADAGEPREAA